MILCTFPKGADGKRLRKIMADLAELSINKALEHLYVSRERNRKLFLRGSRKRLWSSCLLGVLLWQFCPQGSAKATTDNKFWLLNSEGNRDGIFVKGRRQTLLYCYKWGQGKHVIIIKKDQKNHSKQVDNCLKQNTHKQGTLRQKRIKIHQSQITNRDLLNSLKWTSIT